MKKKFKQDLEQAICAYYHFRASGFIFRDKQDCLDDIEKAVRKRHNGVLDFSAIAGTFWFYCVDGDTTVHNETNWREMIIHQHHLNSAFYFC